ncbi:GNAT family N-acetyltransferase [Nocardioides sp. TF02-7]|uniref:GNAT family N-acetyltransferase n=1 Tax=Nocardioides sp. TF02-7 TaxID=2917724 RepID=UPI001F06FCA6|nr:GNAT family N-acetyltransferase [Nocardioides sp. TF02-7]UMG91656.1 GNAT family N-acetyltransferase [Nocardioides sp. TF02-7]
MTARVRPAEPADLPRLAVVEGAADGLFAELFGDPGWDPPTSGEARAAEPGFLLVAEADGVVVGFAHVLDLAGHAHLEQLAVHPEHSRRGHGTALVRAALAEARRRGHDELTLSTYADVPWNAPYYRRLGFRELHELPPHLERVREHERAIGLERHGRRVLMAAPTAIG